MRRPVPLPRNRRGRARLSQRADRKQRSAGFSPLRVTIRAAVRFAPCCDRAVKRAEARAPHLSENLRKNDELSDRCIPPAGCNLGNGPLGQPRPAALTVAPFQFA